MRKWGVPVYLDAGSHVKLDGKPHYYGGILTLYNLTYTLRTNLDGEKSLKAAQDRFLHARKYLLNAGGGIVSIYYHPCEFVHRQFWDGANFARGANPPREQWKLPEAKTEEESRIAYETFFNYIRFIKRFADVKFITARDAAELYKDKAEGFNFPTEVIERMAGAVGEEINFLKYEDMYLSPSELLYLLNSYYLAKMTDADPKGINLVPTSLGPTSPPPDDAVTGKGFGGATKLNEDYLKQVTDYMSRLKKTDSKQFLRTAKDVMDSMRTNGRLPSTVWFGSRGVSPETYLATLAKSIQTLSKGQPLPAEIEFTEAKLATAKYVANDDPKLWGWVIFPPEFKAAPEMMALAKRQAWTIKPAVLHGPK